MIVNDKESLEHANLEGATILSVFWSAIIVNSPPHHKILGPKILRPGMGKEAWVAASAG